MATPTDPLYAQQWQFSLIGNIQKIWDEYDGSGVTVVVYDEGVEYTHPDLAANYDASMHFTYHGVVYDPMPLTPDSGHGTSCAGLIGAVDNNGIGGTGVAPGVTLTGVNYLDDIQYQPQDVYDAAMLWAANFDIMSNSWGWGGSYSGAQNLADPTSMASQDIALWEQVVATGRDGLGTIIVKAAGNETHNVNGDGWNVSRLTITVSATDNLGRATYYTNYGSAVLVAAPAAAVTTDLTGNAGYNNSTDGDPVPVDYTSTFNGTSAATPVVAGVVALMLDAAPGLGWRDVNNILALSASHTGSALGGPGSGYETGSWQTMGGNTWNGGGTMFHQSYGYGMVDAFAAVRMAEAWAVLFGSQAKTSANELSATANYTGGVVNIPDNDGVAGTGQARININSTSTIQIETIYITLTLTHTNAKDLNIWLKAPDGEMIALFSHDANARTMDNGLTWTFSVEALRGYSAAGTWSIVVEDTVSLDVGTISGAEITFYGSSDTKNDVFTFTDDFQALAALEPSRQLINDTDGGVDWLNFAAIANNLNVSMAAGGLIKFNGVTVAHLDSAATDFEKLYAGDGKDTIAGNQLNNTIDGMRGNDSLHGNNGNDLLDGGAGTDALYGDSNNDTLRGGDGNDVLNGGSGNDSLVGQGGDDVFVFGTGMGGADKVSGFQDNHDTLKFDDALWGGGKTIAQVLAAFAHVVGADTVFDFGGGNTVTLLGFTNINALSNDIVLF